MLQNFKELQVKSSETGQGAGVQNLISQQLKLENGRRNSCYVKGVYKMPDNSNT